MLLGGISRVYFIIVVVWLVKKARFEESFELIRGRHDVFSNSECSQTEDYEGAFDDKARVGYDQCVIWCQKYGANCKDMACSYCICNGSDKNYTYIVNDAGDGRCKRDEEVLPESVSTTGFRVWNGRSSGTCLTVDDLTNQVTTKDCNSFSPETHWIWIWTGKLRRLMNIKTLQCVEVASEVSNDLRRVTMKPCDLDLWKQTLYCNTNGPYFWNRRQRENAYLILSSSKVLSATISMRGLQHWYKYPHYTTICSKSVIEYTGCYRFADGSFLRFLSYDEQCIEQEGTCVHKVNISAPIFTENAKCAIIWEESEYLHHGDSWEFVEDYENHYFDLEATNEDNVKLLKVNIGASKILNGSLIKLNIICHNGQRTEEKHCVLLKFKTLPRSEVQISNRSSSQSSKAVAISVPIVLLIIIVCVGAGVLVIYRRRKGGQPELTTNEGEMQSCESGVAQNPSTNVYEDPTQTYEPLKVNQRGTGDEQPYQGHVGLHSQDKDTSVYDYIDDKSVTNPGTEGEYSYASNENLPKSFAPSQPLPSAPIVYQTLEEPDGSDNPAFEHDKLSHNNGNELKNEPFDEKCTNPVYQTLEEQEAVQNPKSKLNNELTDKSLDSVGESVEKQSPLNPVYQTLEEQEAVQYPKSLDSVERSLDQQSQNPTYQTLEEPEALQNPNSKLDNGSTDKGLDFVAKESLDRQSQNSVY